LTGSNVFFVFLFFQNSVARKKNIQKIEKMAKGKLPT
jgi:hypothetical protein